MIKKTGLPAVDLALWHYGSTLLEVRDLSDRGDPASLRGWISDVYFPALLSGAADQLVRRLGARASVDDPLYGRASGDAVRGYLRDVATQLMEVQATFTKVAFTLGADRDVTEGTLEVACRESRVAIPVGVVAVRRPGRELIVRVYFDARHIGGRRAVRTPLVPGDAKVSVPPAVAAHLQALDRGDLDGVIATFEPGAAVRDPRGCLHAREESTRAMWRYYKAIFDATSRGVTWHPGGQADDGRTCAIEVTVDGSASVNADGHPGLAVYEIGDSGLLRALRLYEEHA